MSDDTKKYVPLSQRTVAEGGNLIPKKPGESGNPNGRPKGVRNRKTVVREVMQMLVDGVDLRGEELPDPITAQDAMTMAIMRKALAGDVAAWEKLMDSLHGKIADKVDNTHEIKKMGSVVVGEGKKELSFEVGNAAKRPQSEEDSLSEEEF